MRRTGVTTETYKRFLVDAGAVYINYGLATERLLGATRGGNSFVIDQEIRVLEVDGLPGQIKGGRRIISVIPRITANLIELTSANIALAIAGADIVEADPAAVETAGQLPNPSKTHDIISRSRNLSAADYVENVALVGEISGSTQPAIFIVKNGLSDGGLEIGTTDREEAVVELSISGHFSGDPDEFDEEPWEIRFPADVNPVTP